MPISIYENDQNTLILLHLHYEKTYSIQAKKQQKKNSIRSLHFRLAIFQWPCGFDKNKKDEKKSAFLHNTAKQR